MPLSKETIKEIKEYFQYNKIYDYESDNHDFYNTYDILTIKQGELILKSSYNTKQNSREEKCVTRCKILNNKIVSFDQSIWGDFEYGTSGHESEAKKHFRALLEFFDEALFLYHFKNTKKKLRRESYYYFEIDYESIGIFFGKNNSSLEYRFKFIKKFPIKIINNIMSRFGMKQLCEAIIKYKSKNIMKEYFKENPTFKSPAKNILIELLNYCYYPDGGYDKNIQNIMEINNISFERVFNRELNGVFENKNKTSYGVMLESHFQYKVRNSKELSLDFLRDNSSKFKDLHSDVFLHLIHNYDITELIIDNDQTLDKLFECLGYDISKIKDSKLNIDSIVRRSFEISKFVYVKKLIMYASKEILDYIIKNPFDNVNYYKAINKINKVAKDFDSIFVVLLDSLGKSRPLNLFEMDAYYEEVISEKKTDRFNFYSNLTNHKSIDIYNKYCDYYNKYTGNIKFRITVEKKYGKGCFELTSETRCTSYTDLGEFLRDEFDIHYNPRAKTCIPKNVIDEILDLFIYETMGKDYGISYKFKCSLNQEILRNKLESITLNKSDSSYLDRNFKIDDFYETEF